jgi:hypothetical protein
MNASDDKPNHEHEVFLAFAQAAQRNIDPRSVRSQEPPEPDLWCCCEREPTYFEFGSPAGPKRAEVAHQGLAPDPVAVDPMTIRLPKRGMLPSKLDKQYSVGNTPLESLLYFDAG